MLIFQVIPDDILEGIIKACHSGSYEKLEACVENMMAEGYSASQLIGQIHDKIVPAENLTDKQKAVICERLSVRERHTDRQTDGQTDRRHRELIGQTDGRTDRQETQRADRPDPR